MLTQAPSFMFLLCCFNFFNCLYCHVFFLKAF
uniref:Uncharacterized protein n=1 Tax=Anguilla anguilla TaxID=7936 RepID=A0A0E9XZ73_ANGAN